MLTVALFMLVAFFGLKGLGAPDWASVLVSVAVGEFLWSKERRRAAREDHNAWLQQMIMTQALMLETKVNDLMIKLQKLDGEMSEANTEQEPQTKAQLM
jgi:hypothetical protein